MFIPPRLLDALRHGVALARRVCAAGLFLCRCGALYGDLRGGFVVAGVSGAGCLLWGVVRRLVASGGVSCGVLWFVSVVVVSCGVSCGVASWVVSCGVLWGVASVVRVVVAGRGAARVSPCVSCRVAGSEANCLFHVEDRGAGPVFSLSVISPPPPPGRGAESFLQVVCVFRFKMGGIFARFSVIFYMVFDIKKPPGAVFSSGVFFIWVRWWLFEPLDVDGGGDVVGCLIC